MLAYMVLFLSSPDLFEKFLQTLQIQDDFLHHFQYFVNPIPILSQIVFVSIVPKKMLLIELVYLNNYIRYIFVNKKYYNKLPQNDIKIAKNTVDGLSNK